MFRTAYREILDRLVRIDERLSRVEAQLETMRSEPALRADLDRKQKELEALAEQSLHIVDQLDQARRRVRELEAGGS